MPENGLIPEEGIYPTIAVVNNKQSFNFRSLGLIFKPGISLDFGNKSIVNFGLAVSHQIRDNLYYAGSFRTNFNSFDDKNLSFTDDFVPNMIYWDMYHITSGVVITGPRTELSVGLEYGFAYSSGDMQVVNMTNPTQENFLQGPLNNNTKTRAHVIGLVMGLSYNFSIIEGLKR